MQNLQVGLGAVLALDTSAFLARQPPPRQPETTRHDGITPSNTPPSIRHPTHRLLWDAPENRASGPPSTPAEPHDLRPRSWGFSRFRLRFSAVVVWATRGSSSCFVLIWRPGHPISLGHAPAIPHRNAPSRPRPHRGMAQRLGRVRLHAHRRPDGGRARGARWRAVARLAAAGHWLPRSGHRAPALGRGDGPARGRNPAQARRQAGRVDAAYVVPYRTIRWSVLEIRDARLNRRRWG
jgi:hypothetical protein